MAESLEQIEGATEGEHADTVDVDNHVLAHEVPALEPEGRYCFQCVYVREVWHRSSCKPCFLTR